MSLIMEVKTRRLGNSEAIVRSSEVALPGCCSRCHGQCCPYSRSSAPSSPISTLADLFSHFKVIIFLDFPAQCHSCYPTST